MGLEKAGLVCFSSYPTNVVLELPVYYVLLIQQCGLEMSSSYDSPTVPSIIRLSLFTSPPTSSYLSAWDTKPYGKL